MSWVIKIIEGKPDEFAHAKLIKYGIGTHPGPRIKLSLSKTSIRFKADLDLEKDILKGYLMGAPEGPHKVKGNLITYTDNREKYETLMMPITWKKSKKTIFQAKINEVAPLKDINALFELDDPTTFYLLSMNPRDGTKPWKVATKTSFPKGGPKEEDEEKGEKDPVFSKGALGNTPEIYDYVLEKYIPDFKDKITPKTKNIMIRNNIEILNIEIPSDPGLSAAEKRRMAKKRGKLIRDITIDDNDYSQEYEFLV
ncbi:MAG: hypothetical protein ACFFEK_11450 [Candidatus Thorarchaeota archaeon]